MVDAMPRRGSALSFSSIGSSRKMENSNSVVKRGQFPYNFPRPFLAYTGLRLTTCLGGGRLWTFEKAAGKIGEGESQQRTQTKRTHALTLFAFCSSPLILCSLFLSPLIALSSLIFFHLVTFTTCV